MSKRDAGFYIVDNADTVAGNAPQPAYFDSEKWWVVGWEIGLSDSEIGKVYGPANLIPMTVKTPEQPMCCVCGTTENVRYDGWYGYRCDSEDCMVL